MLFNTMFSLNAQINRILPFFGTLKFLHLEIRRLTSDYTLLLSE